MRRTLILALVAMASFGGAAFLMIQLMPQPMKNSDYLVVGSVGTLVALLVLFLAVVSTSKGTKDVFFKKRKKTR